MTTLNGRKGVSTMSKECLVKEFFDKVLTAGEKCGLTRSQVENAKLLYVDWSVYSDVVVSVERDDGDGLMLSVS